MRNRFVAEPLIPAGCQVVQLDIDPLEIARNQAVSCGTGS